VNIQLVLRALIASPGTSSVSKRNCEEDGKALRSEISESHKTQVWSKVMYAVFLDEIVVDESGQQLLG